MFKSAAKIRFRPGSIPLLIIKGGLPIVFILFVYIAYYRLSAEPEQLIYISREIYSMIEHALMTLAIVIGGAAAFEAVTRSE